MGKSNLLKNNFLLGSFINPLLMNADICWKLKNNIPTNSVKSVRIRKISGPYFPAFGLDTEIYRVNFCFQSKYGKIRTRKTPNAEAFYAVKSIWQYETLQYFHKKNNIYELFAIKTCEEVEIGHQIVGHLPNGISSLTRFLLDRSVVVTSNLSNTNYSRSPLVQRRLHWTENCGFGHIYWRNP